MDDLSGEYGVGVAVAGLAALALSPRLRGLVRRGAVAGLTGLLAIGDIVGGRARQVGQVESGGLQVEAMDAQFMRELAREARSELASHQQQSGR